MRTRITYELAGSKPKRNLELVIETSCDASPATEVACRVEGGWEKAFSLVVGFGVWQRGNGSEEQGLIFLLLYFFYGEESNPNHTKTGEERKVFSANSDDPVGPSEGWATTKSGPAVVLRSLDLAMKGLCNDDDGIWREKAFATPKSDGGEGRFDVGHAVNLLGLEVRSVWFQTNCRMMKVIRRYQSS
ncbi:hypothetical protein TIFTF001_049235 [Ficus carica]|uniref:Uncharacterized protein n=1 Tax=Ficus carica TaxID=3494 RepID=A0AA87YY77_FICCA|nr:hypothetical protein TIFTF001_049234 [Ficus carica]GMN25728.1 hypothetical protein TIFTF001_049235 [Ficus carica]